MLLTFIEFTFYLREAANSFPSMESSVVVRVFYILIVASCEWCFFCDVFFSRWKVRSKEGFHGCLASVDLNGELLSLDEPKVNLPREFHGLVTQDCEGQMCSRIDPASAFEGLDAVFAMFRVLAESIFSYFKCFLS